MIAILYRSTGCAGLRRHLPEELHSTSSGAFYALRATPLISINRKGSGKTSIARELAKELCATYLRIDTIEQAIRRYDNADINVGPMGYFVASDTARDNLAFGLTVIIDSVNPMKLTRDWYRDVALTAGVPYLEIEVVCSDVQEHRTRVGDIEDLPFPDWAQ